MLPKAGDDAVQKPSPHTSKIRFALLIVLLAILCVGGAELVASYFFAPEWFEKTTAPVRNGANAVITFCRETASDISEHVSEGLDRLSDGLERLSARLEEALEPEPEADPEPLSDPQLADKPLYETTSPITDPSVTELKIKDGKDILTGGNVEIEYFNQASEVWADQPYGSDDIGRYGCGPTVMAMVVNSMTEHESDPAQMAQWAVDNHHWAKESGSYHSIVMDAAQSFGLSARSIADKTPESVRASLLARDVVVALMGPGHFTNGGHFIIIHGITLSGTVLVADPNSVDRSLMEWDLELILSELSASTDSGAPLWAISRGEG